MVWSRSVSELAVLVDGTIFPGEFGPGADALSISEICLSSKEATKGSLFVAIAGAAVDGHAYIDDAISRGAQVVVCGQGTSRQALASGREVAFIEVDETRVAISRLAADRFSWPSKELAVAGITGTNGKTTINWILFHVLNASGRACARLGTLGAALPGKPAQSGMRTTPDALSTQKFLREAVAEGCKAAVLEVSSHALDQHRVSDVSFDVAAFTNLTRDHLDYHKTMEEYFSAKSKLFDLLQVFGKGPQCSVLGIDDPYVERLNRQLKARGLRVLTSGFNSEATIRISSLTHQVSGSLIELFFQGTGYSLRSSLLGRHNAQNIAIAFGCAIAMGLAPQEFIQALGQVPVPRGRLEPVWVANDGESARRGPTVFVDYAHTPDALEKALEALRSVTPGKLWVLFGCGGDRDPGKRPLMGDLAASLADFVVLTSDNPRSEDPNKIIEEVLSGNQASRIRKHGIIEPDRRAAIVKALSQAQQEDVVLIAGKGHEDYQIVGTQKNYFSDFDEVEAYFRSTAPAS